MFNDLSNEQLELLRAASRRETGTMLETLAGMAVMFFRFALEREQAERMRRPVHEKKPAA